MTNYPDRNLTNIPVKTGYVNLVQNRDGVLTDGLGNSIDIITVTSSYANSSINSLTSSLANNMLMTIDMDIFSSSIQYQHPRDPDELTGPNIYRISTINLLGIYELISNNIEISSVIANVWCTNVNRDITFLLYARPSASSFNASTETPIYSASILAANMPHNSNKSGSSFTLNSNVTVNSGSYLYAIWTEPVGNELSMTYFQTSSLTTPDRHGFLLGGVGSPLVVNISDINYGFYSPTFKLNGNKNISRQPVFQLSNNAPEIVTNGGFESVNGNNFNFWNTQILESGRIINETSSVHSGSHAVKLIPSANDTQFYSTTVYQILSNVTTGSYQLTLWTKGDGVNAGKFGLVSSAGWISFGISTGISGSDIYRPMSYSFSYTTGSNLYLYLGTSKVSGSVVYYDDVSVKKIGDFVNVLTPVSINDVLSNFQASKISFKQTSSLTSTNVQDAILEVYNKITSSNIITNSIASPRILLPDTISAVVGDTLQVFTRGVVEDQNPYNYPNGFICDIGSSYPRYFEVTPLYSQLGNHTLTCKIYDINGNPISSGSTQLIVVSASHQPTNSINVLCVGDSLTAPGVWPTEFSRRLVGSGGTPLGNNFSNIIFLGNNGSGNAKFVGYGGWTWNTYMGLSGIGACWLSSSHDKTTIDQKSSWKDISGSTWTLETIETGSLKMIPYGGANLTMPAAPGTLSYYSGGTHTSPIYYTSITLDASTPFWNISSSQFSFLPFASASGVSNIDIMYVLLSWNGLSTPNKFVASDHNSNITQSKLFLDKFHTEFPSASVRLLGLEIPSTNGGLGANYGASETYIYYNLVRSVNGWNLALQKLSNTPPYNTYCNFIGIASQFDSEWNMSYSSNPVNTRNSTTENRGTNGVHPATQGYYQIADAAYRDFIRTFCYP